MTAPVTLLKPRRIGDSRGWFSETFSSRDLAAAGLSEPFCQDNHSYSAAAFTLRGLHFQTPPHAQAKLVRCTRGRILDVAVDIRRGSPTFGRHLSAELTAENGWQLLIPVGYAHGFLTLEPDCEIQYKVSDYYAPDCDAGIAWDDPTIAFPWPLPPDGPVLSSKDRALPGLADVDSPFPYEGDPMPAELG